MKTILIKEDSPLRRPPVTFGCDQILILDGLRYSAEMAHIAYERLSAQLQSMARCAGEPAVRDVATAMLDAWSIIDSSHRYRDLVQRLPGLRKQPNQPWKRQLLDATKDAADLRNCVQHQSTEIRRGGADGAQIWGYLSWVGIRDGKYTGSCLMAAAGTTFVGGKFIFVGPAKLPFPVPPDRIRLNAFGKEVYLGRVVRALAEASHELEDAISRCDMRPRGVVADRQNADVVMETVIQVAILRNPRADN